MVKSILLFSCLVSQFAIAQICEDYNTLNKSQLEALGWESDPTNGWSVAKTGAYSSKSLFVSAGIGNVVYLASPCCTANGSSETLNMVYTFSSGSGTLSVGIQSGLASIGTGVTWLDTFTVVNSWTNYTLNFSTTTYNPYRIVFFIGNTNASTKIGFDNFCLANSSSNGSCVMLPVELSTLSAEVLNTSQSVELTWQTESEHHSKSFTILRAGSNMSFDSIATVSAGGDSYSLLSYSYMDRPGFSGDTYYRLKCISEDGTYTFSKIVNVPGSDVNNSSLFVNNGILHYTGNNSTRLVICSEQGQMIYNKEIPSNINEDLSFLPPGIYFARTFDSMNAAKSFVIY